MLDTLLGLSWKIRHWTTVNKYFSYSPCNPSLKSYENHVKYNRSISGISFALGGVSRTHLEASAKRR